MAMRGPFWAFLFCRTNTPASDQSGHDRLLPRRLEAQRTIANAMEEEAHGNGEEPSRIVDCLLRSHSAWKSRVAIESIEDDVSEHLRRLLDLEKMTTDEVSAVTYERLITATVKSAKALKLNFLKYKSNGTIVAVGVRDGLAHVLTLLSIVFCGAAFMPVDCVNEPYQRIADQLRTAAVFLGTQSCKEALCIKAMKDSDVNIDIEYVDVDRLWKLALDQTEDESIAAFKSTVIARDLISVYFTSGSTGKPKGVLAEHRNFSAYTR